MALLQIGYPRPKSIISVFDNALMDTQALWSWRRCPIVVSTDVREPIFALALPSSKLVVAQSVLSVATTSTVLCHDNIRFNYKMLIKEPRFLKRVRSKQTKGEKNEIRCLGRDYSIGADSGCLC